ncbi:MAG TPA: LPXTG cell wall anchor domain-containing protein [Acidimicrobiales bacterium]|jgi:LPXTG-motif cell wall-anchored protein|nr:LPXTG cell wall anchor domain-containing protein [Acidimicrobiales bacterium]
MAAEDYVSNNDGSKVLGTQLSRRVDPVRSAGLPVTGGDIAGMTIVGLAAIGTGTVLVRRSRKSTPASPA